MKTIKLLVILSFVITYGSASAEECSTLEEKWQEVVDEANEALEEAKDKEPEKESDNKSGYRLTF